MQRFRGLMNIVYFTKIATATWSINKIIPVSIALPVTLNQEQKINELDPDCQCRLVMPKGLKLFTRGHIFS